MGSSLLYLYSVKTNLDKIPDKPSSFIVLHFFKLVVQLFNAIKAQQKATDDLTEKVRPITTNSKDKVASLTKASFLDLLKSGTKVAAV
jgi:hypothetical protein